MRIRYFADIRFPLERANGVQTMETCHALAVRGHRVDLVVRPDTHVPPRDPFTYYGVTRSEGLRLDIVPGVTPAAARRLVYLAHALRLGLGADDVDVLYTRDLALAALLARCPSGLRPALVYESHGYAPTVSRDMPTLLAGGAAPSDRKARRLDGRERLVWQRADGYVTITAGLCDELAARFGPRERLVVAPDGARVPDTQPPLPPLGPRRAVVGYAGHLYPWKGVDVLLRALEGLPDVEGLIIGGLAGEPDLDRIRALAARLAPGRVTFAGQVDPPRVAALIAAADVLVVPNTPSRISATYTSPLKLFEYMASGRPIVASDLPSLREVLVDGDTALLAEAGNVDAVRAAIERVLHDRALGERLATRAFEAVRHYSWDRRAERIEALLQAVIAPRRME
ncbi:MAG: glycosyltransferase family 4 protein [Vicinamibacterales bacterium]|nr:glycosyltransferase family 4 protein [Vicinamibacterales bacterium]